MSHLDKNVEAQHFVCCRQEACRDKLTSVIAAAQMAEVAEPLDESGVDSKERIVKSHFSTLDSGAE